MRALVAVLALVGSVVVAGSAPVGAAPDAGVSARISLPSRTLAVGSTMNGRVVVVNGTGHDVKVDGCESWFQVALSGRDMSPQILWHDCLEKFVIPAGRTTYPISVTARYRGCVGEPPIPARVPLCIDGQPPPLPPGQYRARILQRHTVVPDPPSVAVRVIG